MKFNQTSTKDGLIQAVEFWAGLQDGEISGATTLLKIITARINAGFDNIMPRLLSYSDFIRWDDINHTDKPVGTVATQNGVSAFKVTVDDNSLAILNIVDLKIIPSASGTDYVDIERMMIGDPRANFALSPNSSDSGIPSAWVEMGNRICFDRKFNYVNSAGIKLFFEREQSYFVSSDTTKEPGIPKPFHELLALYAALDYVLVNRSTDTATITRIEARIAKKEQDLDDMISLRNPTRVRMTTSYGGRLIGNQSGRVYSSFGDSNK